jgi:hypothetical protein
MSTNPHLERPMPDDDYEDDWDPVDDDGTLPPRPRRRLLTPLSALFAAVVVAALGFYGGVQVQKHQDKGSGGGANALAASFGTRGARGAGGGAGGGGFGGGGGGPAGGGATIGSVANKNGSTLYVKDADGNTVKVKTTSQSTINRMAQSSVGAIHPGDTVIVQGTTSSSGTVTASQITATAAGTTGGLFGGGGFGGGFGSGGGGGGQGGGAGAAPGGAQSGGG